MGLIFGTFLFSFGSALIPVLNVSLVSKEMVSGSFPGLMMALIFLSSCLYAALALRL